MNADSEPVTLPADGSYVLEAYGDGTRSANYAFRLEELNPIDLTPGTIYAGSMIASGHAQLFRVTLPTSEQLRITLDDTSQTNQNELYVNYGAPPTRAAYQYRFETVGADQDVVVPAARAGAWYILVYGNYVPTSSTFTMLVTGAPVLLTGVTPDHHGNGGPMTLTLDGAGFDRFTTAALVAEDGTAYAGVLADILAPTRIQATFAAGTVPPGIYSIRAARADGSSSLLSAAFRVEQGGAAQLVTSVTPPASLRLNAPATFFVDYANTGTLAMPAPLIELIVTGAWLTLDPQKLVSGVWTTANPDDFGDAVQILASGATPGVLQPGESIRVPVYFAGVQPSFSGAGSLGYELNFTTVDDPTPFDWGPVKLEMQPAHVSAAAWDAVWTNLVGQLGTTRGDYVRRLSENAAYFASLGLPSLDIDDLWDYEVRKAFGFGQLSIEEQPTDSRLVTPGLDLEFQMYYSGCILGRYEIGALGSGWYHNWQRFLTFDNEGTVTVHSYRGVEHRFQPDRRGGYLAAPGVRSTLARLPSGELELREPDGDRAVYWADGLVKYVEDRNGNQIVVHYTDGVLTRLSHSAGEWLEFDYTAAGRLQSIIDSAGRTVTFGHAGNYLASVIDTSGQRTDYTYLQSGSLATLHALLSEVKADGSRFFTYDPQGRLQTITREGGAAPLTFTYAPTGKVLVSDVVGNTHEYFYDQRGLVVAERDGQAEMAYFTFDDDRQLTAIADTSGAMTQLYLDRNGNVARFTDALRAEATYTYFTAFASLKSARDGNGNLTNYLNDAAGNLVRLVHPDQSVEQFSYDPHGDIAASVNRRGTRVEYSRDASGRIVSVTYSDGLMETFSYDAQGNLESMSGVGGTTTFVYNIAGQPTRVTYPSGRFLSYTYDTAQRRTQMVDQDGHEVNYHFDVLGRLQSLTDENDALIVGYEYDAASRLSRKELGNGTYTTFGYDELGRLVHLVNHAPDGTVNSFYDYVYNAVGTRTSMTTQDGLWTYEHDLAGQLTRAVFASTNPAMPNQDLTFVYDAAGNRVQTIVNGATTAYSSNNLNQYTSAGAATFQYDADGNLIVRTEGANVWRYRYNSDNRLVEAVTPQGTWRYEYDPLGNRIAAIHNGQRIEYLNDLTGLTNVVAEYDSTGQALARYTYGFDLTSRIDAAGGAAYYDFDEIGSVVGLTGPAGDYLNSYSYLPHGEQLQSTEAVSNPFQFIGAWGVATEASGLHYMRNRHYDSSLGRFTSTDPLGIPGRNQYDYANNNPLQFLDPEGLKAEAGKPKQPWKKPSWWDKKQEEANEKARERRENPPLLDRIKSTDWYKSRPPIEPDTPVVPGIRGDSGPGGGSGAGGLAAR